MLISDIMACSTRKGGGIGIILILFNMDVVNFDTACRALKTFRAISPFLRTKYSKESLNLFS